MKKDTKLSSEDHATEIKKSVGIAYAYLPRHHQEEMTLDLFCSSLNQYLQRHPLAINPGSLVEAVEAGSDYPQIKPGSAYGVNACQIDEDEAIDQARAAQTKLSDMELLLQTLRQLTTKVEGLKKT